MVDTLGTYKLHCSTRYHKIVISVSLKISWIVIINTYIGTYNILFHI